MSLEKGLNHKREDTATSSYKAFNLGYDLEKEAFVDHKKKSMIDKNVKTIEEKRSSMNLKTNLHDKVMKNTIQQQQQQQ